jgi:hypothetical protein
MSICDNNSITEILPTECIGNSLNVINSNFQTLKTSACVNLSGINNLNDKIDATDSRINNFSATVPGIAKAWVKFSGIRGDDNVIDDGISPNINRVGINRLINSNYNVESVYKNSKGDYIVNIKPGIFTSNNIVVLGTSSEKKTSGDSYTWLQPYKIQVSADPTGPSNVFVRVRTNTQATADPDFVSIVMFSL